MTSAAILRLIQLRKTPPTPLGFPIHSSPRRDGSSCAGAITLKELPSGSEIVGPSGSQSLLHKVLFPLDPTVRALGPGARDRRRL